MPQDKTPSRTKDSYSASIYNFINEVFVICPNCSKKAVVKSHNHIDTHLSSDKATLICIHCGYNKQSKSASAISFRPKSVDSNCIVIGHDIDPYFHQPLWLSIELGSNILWAYNYDHLDFLETHVASNLRERNTTLMSNNNIGSRLPRWMTSAKNREVVLKAIEQLKKK